MDINPGDRMQSCQGMMEPVEAYLKAGKIVLLHRCLACKAVKANKSAEGDSQEAILDLMRGQTKIQNGRE